MINVGNKVDCCGCEACYNACPSQSIKMNLDEEGFYYPQVNHDTCINCDLCERVCPIFNYEPRKKNENQEAYLLQHKDNKICRESTAGGAFTGIASYVIQKGGIVFGVEITETYKVRHTSVETIEELRKLRNSKYVQSRVGYSFNHVRNELKTGRVVCFSGTPCQIEGLRHFLGKDYENLILVDVVCRAVPSPGVWDKFVQYEIKQKGELSSVKFRDKALGYQYSTMELKTKDGKVYRDGIECQPWLRMFFSGMIIRPSCTDCRFRSRYRNSDFTIWDCFPSYKYNKNFDEEKGTTRVLIHSEKGRKILKEIKSQFLLCEVSCERAVQNVSEMVISPSPHKNRSEFFSDFQTSEMSLLIKKYFPVTLKLKLKKYARVGLNFVGLDKIIKRYIKK